MAVFRDSFEACPRCGIALVDAWSARACPGCRGLWLDEPVLSEMILEMLPQPPDALSRLQLAVIQRTGDPIACPNCHKPMHATAIHQVELDRCAQHGVWFDVDELRLALERVGDPKRAPPLREHAAPGPVSSGMAPQLHVAPEPARSGIAPGVVEEPSEVAVTFAVQLPGQAPMTHIVRAEVIKIGTLARTHIRIAEAGGAARMHAVIEVKWPGILTLIDLGSSVGTLLNGTPITRAPLAVGDLLTLGETLVEVVAID